MSDHSTVPPLYREISQGDLAIWSVASVAGVERAVIEAIFDGQPDLVYLPNVARSSMQRFERAGIASIPGPSATWWESPSLEAVRNLGLHWQEDCPDWSDLRQRTINGLMPCAALAPDAGERFLVLDGQAVARKALDNALEVTGRPLTAATARALVLALRSSMSANERVLVPNDRVELSRLLAQAGLLPVGTCEPQLLTPLLRRSAMPILVRAFSISSEEVAAFGRLSGDFNPLHFDDAFARAHGFERRISHGMLFNGWLTQLLGNDYPGPGTIFLGNSTVFRAPVYPDAPYEVRVSTPLSDSTRNVYRIVAQLRDAAGNLAALSYSDVMHRPSATAD